MIEDPGIRLYGRGSSKVSRSWWEGVLEDEHQKRSDLGSYGGSMLSCNDWGSRNSDGVALFLRPRFENWGSWTRGVLFE
jgi:hypothetical protein